MDNHQNLLTEEEQKRLYLVHHMHHLQDGEETIHELHHCFLFAQPNMEGEKFTIDHLLSEGKLYHVLDRKPPEVLFDHANNSYPTRSVTLNNQPHFTFD